MSYVSRVAFATILAFAFNTAALAQSPTPFDAPSIGSVFDAAVLSGLPLGENIYALLETTQADVISDRFNSAGLNVGGPTRLDGFLSSWSQTRFRIGDVNVSDPNGGGALLFPEALPWQRVRVDTGLLPAEVNSPGLSVTLEPRPPSARWTGSIVGTGSGGSLTAGAPADQPPPIARLDQSVHGSAVFGGPITNRLGLVAGGGWAGSRTLNRELVPLTRSTLASGFAQVAFAASPERDWRALAWVQRAEIPFPEWLSFQDASAATRDTSLHVQSTWEERPSSGWRWRAFGGFTQRSRGHELGVASVAVERASAGPLPVVVDEAAERTARRLAGGARFAPPGGPGSAHRLEFGVDIDAASTTARDQFAGTAGEFIYSTPARIWTYTSGLGESRRGALTTAGYARDTIAVSPTFTVDASVRAEFVHGRADGAADSIDWISLLPAARVHWQFAERGRVALVGGYVRSVHALNLNWLAYGDPAGPFGTVAAPGRPNVVVSRVGPGTGGDPSFSRIDDDLGRPYTDEFVVGLESRRGASTRFTLTGIARREENIVAVVNTGVPVSGYSAIDLDDEYVFEDNPEDDRTLTVYNRLPSTFGRDTYLLTNPELEAADAYGMRLTAEHTSDRLFLLFGATAYLARGSGGNRGYGPRENDQDVAGELFTNPNAATYSRGRLFSDRAFTIKWTTLYRMPYDISLGAIARYQDGQPFSRLHIVTGLNQGAEAVQAFPNGRTRFTFTGTLDLRLQKGFRIGSTRLDALFDAYNLLTRSNEVEEFVATGPSFRTSTAIQPPHSVHLGLRVAF